MTFNRRIFISSITHQLRSGGRSERLLSMVIHFLIQGRVQGVGFRWFVQREASLLDLRGWVRNTEEGEVEVVASGAAAELDALRAKLRQGPRGSRVDRLNINWPTPRPMSWIRFGLMGRGEKTAFSYQLSAFSRLSLRLAES
jgi:acylphosphatase